MRTRVCMPKVQTMASLRRRTHMAGTPAWTVHHALEAARLHGEGADDQLAAACAHRYVRFRTLGRGRRRKRVFATDAIPIDELPGDLPDAQQRGC